MDVPGGVSHDHRKLPQNFKVEVSNVAVDPLRRVQSEVGVFRSRGKHLGLNGGSGRLASQQREMRGNRSGVKLD